MKLWIFGQSLLASRVNSYMFFGLNCLLKAATLAPVEIQCLVEKAVGTDISHYFETLFQKIGQEIFTLNVITYDDAAKVAYLSRRVAELEEYIEKVTPSLQPGNSSKRWYEKMMRKQTKRTRRQQRRVRTYTRCVQWLKVHPRVRLAVMGPINVISWVNLFNAQRQFPRIHSHYFRTSSAPCRMINAPNLSSAGNLKAA